MSPSRVSKLKKIRDLLAPLQVPVYHHRKPVPDKVARYIVWAEDGANQFAGNNRITEQAISGTIDLYTQAEYDPLVDAVQAALNTGEHVIWSLESIEYEDETALIHWQWVFSVS